MKTKFTHLPRVLLLGGLFACGCLHAFAGPATTVDLDVGIRSASDVFWVKSKATAREAAEKTRSQPYGLFFVTLAPGQDKLVRDVNAVAIAVELEAQLQAQGFIKAKAGTKPGILISAEYGRGWLPNPYETGSQLVGNNGLSNSSGGMSGFGSLIAAIPTYNIHDAQSGMRASNPQWVAKRQKDSMEKLYIRVRAWQYPKSPKEKLKPIWTTYMVVDDPEHRDLNDVFKPMLAAGASYFGHALDDPDKPEEMVKKPMPIGHVDVGPTTVVDKNE